MLESLELSLLAAWCGLAFIPLIGFAFDALLVRQVRQWKAVPAAESLDRRSLLAGLHYELELLP